MASLDDLQAVVAAWIDINGRLQKEQNSAQTKRRARLAANLARMRLENDRAYFLLMFARFEAYLTSRARALIIRRQGSRIGRRGADGMSLMRAIRAGSRS